MMAITAADIRANEAMVQAIVENEPSKVSGVLGMHALAKLADTLPHQDFAGFVNDTLAQINASQPQQAQGQPEQPQQPQPTGAPQ